MTEFHRLDPSADARFLRAGLTDPITGVAFRPTNEVVLCDTCGRVSLRETWEALGGCPNGHDTPARWSTTAALAAGDGAATGRPTVAAARRADPEPERNRWLTPLLVAIGVAGLVALGVVVLGLLRDDDAPVEAPVEAAPEATGPDAVPITAPGLLEGSLTDDDFATDDGRYQDLYTFAADSSGRVLSFRASSEDFYPRLIVETPEGERLTAELVSEDEDSGARTVAVENLRGPGLYRVLLSSRQPGATGDYAVRLVSEAPVRPLAPNGNAVRSTLGEFSEREEGFYRDRYRFSGAEGREHTVTVRSSAFSPVLTLQGPSGAVRGETGRAGGVVTFVFTPGQSGTHTLIVTSQAAGGEGAYTVQLAVEAPPTPVAPRTLAADGRPFADTLSAGDTRAYAVRGDVGDRLDVEVRADGFTPTLTLVGPDGNRTPASPDGDRARLRDVTLSTGGTYRVIVGGADGGGPFRVILERRAAVAPEDIPRLPGADAIREAPRPAPADGGGDYQPQPIGDNGP